MLSAWPPRVCLTAATLTNAGGDDDEMIIIHEKLLRGRQDLMET